MAAAQPPSERLIWVDEKLRGWKDATESVTAVDVKKINTIINEELGTSNISMLQALDDLNKLCESKLSTPSSALNLGDKGNEAVKDKVQEVFLLVHPIVAEVIAYSKPEAWKFEFEEPQSKDAGAAAADAVEEESVGDEETGDVPGRPCPEEWRFEFEESQSMDAGASAAAATAAGDAASAAEAGTPPVHYFPLPIPYRDDLTTFDQSNKSEADFNALMHAGWTEMGRVYEGARSYMWYIQEDPNSTTEAADAKHIVQDFEKIVRRVWTTMEERKPKTLTEPAEELFREQKQDFSIYLEGIIESVSNAEIYKDKTEFNMRWDAFLNFVTQ